MVRRKMEEELDALFRESRSNAQTRKHHLVPASHLRRWTRDGQLNVTDLSESKKSYSSSAETAARITDFYAIRSEQIDEDELPPMLMETMLSKIEGNAVAPIDRLIEVGPSGLSMEDAHAICRFVGFQIQRGRHGRQLLTELSSQSAKLLLTSMSDESIGRMLRKRRESADEDEIAEVRRALDTLNEGTVEVRAPKAMLIWLAADAGEKSWKFLATRRWMVCHSGTEIVTCHEPVAFVSASVRQDGAPRGLGLSSAIIFPLDPHHLLVMFHPDMPIGMLGLKAELLPSEAEEINTVLAWNASRWIFERAESRRLQNLWIPPHSPEKLMLTRLPLSEPTDGELAHFRSRPRIHPSLPGLRRPVDRWFTEADRQEFLDMPYDPDALEEFLIYDWPPGMPW